MCTTNIPRLCFTHCLFIWKNDRVFTAIKDITTVIVKCFCGIFCILAVYPQTLLYTRNMVSI